MMFTRSFFIAFLACSLSVQAVPDKNFGNFGNKNFGGNKQQNATKNVSTQNAANAATCAAPKTVTSTSTVTVTRGVAATSAAGSKTTAAAATKTTAATAATTTAAAGGNNAGGNNAGGNDPQKSTTLDPRVLASAFANDGQDVPAAGQVPSLTSTNNFINFCLTTPNLPITNGKQITTGSCNPAPIGVIPSVDNMPSSKFQFPTNFATLKAGTTFTITMAIQKMQTGFFVNAQESYFAAPQTLNAQGQIMGHSHVVIEQLTSLFQTTPTDPKKFAFFKGLNAAAQNGKLTAEVTGGLQPGFYKLSSINSSSNHQPVIVPVAQHGSLDDAVYFTVTTTGQALTAGTTAKSTGKRRALNRLAA